MDVILNLMKSRLVSAYTDGFSDSYCNRGGSGTFFAYTTGSTAKNNESRGSPVGRASDLRPEGSDSRLAAD